MSNDVFLLLGTNLGNRIDNLEIAIQNLKNKNIKVVQLSSIYESDPWGKTNQPLFLNQIIRATLDLSPQELLVIINEIEITMGRVRFEKWKERVIDIDILYFNDIILNEKHLTIPHPEIQNRNFTLVPLCELAPNSIHPTFNVSNLDLLKNCKDALGVTKV